MPNEIKALSIQLIDRCVDECLQQNHQIGDLLEHFSGSLIDGGTAAEYAKWFDELQESLAHNFSETMGHFADIRTRFLVNEIFNHEVESE